MSPRGPLRASSTQKPAFAKTLKTKVFFRFLGSRGLPREPEEAQDGSQEAPKELQSLNKKGSKNGPQNYDFFDQFWSNFGVDLGTQNPSKTKSIFRPILDPILDPQDGRKEQNLAALAECAGVLGENSVVLRQTKTD